MKLLIEVVCFFCIFRLHNKMFLAMKKSIIIFLFVSIFFSLVSCEGNEKQKQPTAEQQELLMVKEKAKVADLLDQLATATEVGDIQKIGEIWCPKDKSMLIGTENNEKLMGWPEIKKAISSQSSSLSEMLISITDQNILLNPDANTAWFFEELNYNFIYNDKAMSFEGIRFTGVFMKSPEGAWKLVQGHMSVPAQIEVGK